MRIYKSEKKNETHSESHTYEKLIYRKQKTRSMEYMKTWHHQALVLKVMEIGTDDGLIILDHEDLGRAS
jgi:hypothetical protein